MSDFEYDMKNEVLENQRLLEALNEVLKDQKLLSALKDQKLLDALKNLKLLNALEDPTLASAGECITINPPIFTKDDGEVPIKISRLKQQILGFRSVIRHLYDALYWARKSGLHGEDISVMVDLIDKLDAQEFYAQKALDELEKKEN